MTASFVTSVTTSLTATGTSITATMPSTITTGDLIVIHVMHRDTLTTPTGFTLASTAGPTGEFNQRHSVVYKFSTDGSEASADITIAQATSQRLIAHTQIFRGVSSQTPTVMDSSIAAGITDISTYAPSLDALTADSLVICGMSSSLAATSGNTSVTSENLVQTSSTSASQLRIAAGYGWDYSGRTVEPSISTLTSDSDLAGVTISFEAEIPPPTAQVSQAAILILYGVDSNAQVSQAAALVLYRKLPRRVFTTTY